MSYNKEGKYNKIASVVDQWIAMNGLTEHWWQWALAAGMWHLRELKLDIWQDVKTIELPVTTRRTVTLPEDFVDWVKIGFKHGQYVKVLSIHDDLAVSQRVENSSDVTSLLKDNIPNGIDFDGYTFMNFNGSSLSGIGGGLPSKGHFKVHDNGTSKEILLDYDYPYSKVYIEFITSGFDPCGESVLHPYLADFFYKGIEYTYEDKRNSSATESSIWRKGQDLYFAEKKVRARRNNLDPATMIAMSRRETRFTPKI